MISGGYQTSSEDRNRAVRASLRLEFRCRPLKKGQIALFSSKAASARARSIGETCTLGARLASAMPILNGRGGQNGKSPGYVENSGDY